MSALDIYGRPRRYLKDHFKIKKEDFLYRKKLIGEQHPQWKGGKSIDHYGYILIRKPDHHSARNGYIPEHRLVWEHGKHTLVTQSRRIKKSDFIISKMIEILSVNKTMIFENLVKTLYECNPQAKLYTGGGYFTYSSYRLRHIADILKSNPHVKQIKTNIQCNPLKLQWID